MHIDVRLDVCLHLLLIMLVCYMIDRMVMYS